MQALIQKISEIIRQIESEYPELYRYLDENPITLPKTKHPKVNEEVLDEYLRSLELLLRNHKKSHPRNSNTFKQ